MAGEGSAPETGQPVRAVGLNRLECSQRSEYTLWKDRNFVEDPIKRIFRVSN